MIKAVLFDVDGVLIDSEKANILLFQDIVEKYGGVRPSCEIIKHSLGLETSRILMDCAPHATELQLSLMLKACFREYKKYLPLISLTEGAKEVLPEIKRRAKTGIVTNRDRKSTIEVLKTFGIADYFDAIVGIGDAEKPKPDASPINLSLELLHASPNEALFVGDTKTDIACGKAAGVKVLFLSRGRETNGFKNVITSLRQVPPFLSRLH